MKDHTRCERIRMLLSDVGLDPDRMMCVSEEDLTRFPGADCTVAAGTHNEGFTVEEINLLTDRAIELSGTGPFRVRPSTTEEP